VYLFVENFQTLLLIVMRMLGLFVVAPFFSSSVIPARMKVIISLFTALLLYPLVITDGFVPPATILQFGLALLGELIIGLIFGFMAAILFTAFQLAGQFFSMQMGFGINEVFDPVTQIQIPVIGQFQSLIALLVFIFINGHHSLLMGLVNSFDIAPVSQFTASIDWGILTKGMIEMMSKMFLVALQLAFPIMGTMFLMTVTQGLLAKAAPQMNLLMIGFPIKIFIGLIMLWSMMPLFCSITADFLDTSYSQLLRAFDGTFQQVWDKI